MKTFGLIVPSGKGRNFDANVRRLLVDRTELSDILLPLLNAWFDMRMRAADLTKLLCAVARKLAVTMHAMLKTGSAFDQISHPIRL